MLLVRNTLYSFGASAIPLAVGLLTVPLYVSIIGLERYGALAIVWLLLGYFGQADFGIGRAISQRIAANREATTDWQARAVTSAFVSMLGIGLVGGALLYIFAGYFFSGPFKIAPELRAELIAAVWVLALSNPIVAISGVASGALIGVERFKWVSISGMVGSIGTQVAPLAYALLVDADLTYLIIFALLGRCLGACMVLGAAWWHFLRRTFAWPDWGEIHKLTNFGVWIMVTAIVGPLMVFADRFVIGSVQGAVAVAVYAIPFQIAMRTMILPISVVNALFPRFASVKPDKSSGSCADYTIFVGQIFAPVAIALICLAEPLLRLWLGELLDARSIIIGMVVMAGFWINAVANVPYAFIQARGNPRFTALLHLAELPIYAVLLLALGQAFGLVGIAAAFSLRCALDCVALMMRSGKEWPTAIMPLASQASLIVFALIVGFLFEGWTSKALAAAFLSMLSLWVGVRQLPDAIRTRFDRLPVVGPIVRANHLG